jgi:hypothetical protein
MIYSLSKWSLFFLLVTNASAFTLNNSLAARYKKSKVSVRVASNTDTCTNAGTTESELLSYVEPAIEEFWNGVPTSRLRLVEDGYLETSDANFRTGKLCVIGEATCTGATIPEVSDIVITCNNNTVNNFPTSTLLALTLPTNLRNKNILGSVIIINDAAGSLFGQLSKAEKISVIAHEIGHAVGLGHSLDKAALMYYQTIPNRFSLGEDDIDGITYLYPTKMDACGLMAGTGGFEDAPSSFWGSFIFGLVALVLVKLMKKFWNKLRFS